MVLENDRVIVKDATFYPGDKAPGMHTHKLPHVGVIIDGGTLVMRSPDGKLETLNLAAGRRGLSRGERDARADGEGHVADPRHRGRAEVAGAGSSWRGWRGARSRWRRSAKWATRARAVLERPRGSVALELGSSGRLAARATWDA